jgi:hypothetical protein
MRPRLCRLAALTALALFAAAAPAHAEIVSPAGACAGSATWKKGGITKTSAGLTPADIIEIPRSDEVSWKGSVAGPAAGASREVAGGVALRLPWPLGTLDLADWGAKATAVEQSGTYRYDLPAVVPSGVVLELQVTHDEKGQRHCTAEVGVVIAGGPFDSPLIWAALAGVLLLVGALALLGRSPTRPSAGRIVGGGLLGLPFGLFLGLTLVLLGLIPLASPIVTILLPVGVAAGALWTWWSPLGPGSLPTRAA